MSLIQWTRLPGHWRPPWAPLHPTPTTMIKFSRLLRIALIILVMGLSPADAQTNNAFVSTSLTLYQPDGVLRERTGNNVVPLSSYVKELNSAAEKAFASVPRSPGVTGSIVVAVKPGKLSRFWLVLGKNKLPKGLAESLLKQLSAITPLQVSKGPIAIAINFNAWGGGQPILAPNEQFPIPDEWQAAMQGQTSGVIPDAPLHIIWP